MYRLTLEWLEGSQVRSKVISALEENESSKAIRIGRDDQQCDVVLNDPTKTVSRLHAEIFYKPDHRQLYLRNSTRDRSQPSFVLVDRQRVIEQEALLQMSSVIQLGKVMITVRSLDILQPQLKQPQQQSSIQEHEYGLQCINGHQISYDHVQLFCPHCGTALQSVQTILIPRSSLRLPQ